jgi:succinyl-diaminopimelate desuccinylase
MTDLIEFAKALISRESITPDDKGCQKLIIKELSEANFNFKKINSTGVDNLFAWHGVGNPFFIFAGHTDVVPPGPLEAWHTDPFQPVEKNGFLYGRGAADMKAADCAMVLSAKEFVLKNPNHKGMIGLVFTSDEEGLATDGTIKVVEYLKQENKIPDYVVVGEASSKEKVGDAIKIGRRGSMHGELTIIGKQGHIAYPQKADNPIHRCFKALDALAQEKWDQGDEHFPPTSFQFFELQSGAGAANVIPGTLTAKFNFRFSPMSTPDSLHNKIADILSKYDLRYKINYHVSSEPFFSGECDLSQIAIKAIQGVCGIHPELNTEGGTSDGRFFAALGCEVIEIGVVNKTIHKVNECVNIKELKQLNDIYQCILKNIF